MKYQRDKRFEKEYKSFDQSAPAIAKKIDRLLLDIMEHPETGIGKPERLKWHNDRCIYSRRIDEKNRLVYEIDYATNTIIFGRCKGHYEDN